MPLHSHEHNPPHLLAAPAPTHPHSSDASVAPALTAPPPPPAAQLGGDEGRGEEGEGEEEEGEEDETHLLDAGQFANFTFVAPEGESFLAPMQDGDAPYSV